MMMQTSAPKVHVHCNSLPQLELGGGTGLTPAKYVRYLMEVTGEEIDVCIDLYDFVVRRAMAGHFNHLNHKKFGPFSRVVEAIRHEGGRRLEVTSQNNGYGGEPVYEDVTATILFYAPFGNWWGLAKVTGPAYRPNNFFGGREADEWMAKALAAVYPQFAGEIAASASRMV